MGRAFAAGSETCLIDTDHGRIVDVVASRSTKTADLGALRSTRVLA